MNKRLYYLAFVLLFALIGFQVVLLVRPKTDAWLGVVSCRATNAGVPISAKSARVAIFPKGRRTELLAQGNLTEPLRVPGGEYDVRVEYAASDDRQDAWIAGLQVKAGEVHKGEAAFSAGTVKVRVRVGGGRPPAAETRCDVFRAGDYTQPVTTKRADETALIAAGDYDIRVVLLEGDKEKSSAWLRGVRVEEGVLAEREVGFQRGELLITARNEGEPLPADSVALTVFRAGDSQREVVDEGTAGTPLALPAGVYDIRAVLKAASDQPEVWLRSVPIEDGKRADREARFAAGFLKVGARLEGGEELSEFRAYVYVYPIRDHRQAVTYFPAGETILLSKGEYDLRVHFFRSHDQPEIWKYGIAVQPGRKAEHRISFRSGRLVVRCFRGGEEQVGDNAFVSLFAKGERRTPIATARAGEELMLEAGSYDLRARHTVAPGKEVWVSGISVRPGVVTDQTVRMD